MRILIVDDDALIVDLIATACAADGHTVGSCTSSVEALEYLQTRTVDLLITDIAMPAVDGLELVRRARGQQPLVIALLITGYASRYSLKDVHAAGASDLLLKPFRLQELRARIDLAQERRRAIARIQARRARTAPADRDALRGLELELREALQPFPDSPLRRVAS
jgi:DNA-binding response OmpR family regulator